VLIGSDSTANDIANDQRRKLVLVSKIVQNLSNQLIFGNKEPYLQELNPLFMTVFIPRVRSLLLFLAVCGFEVDINQYEAVWLTW
jgi:hypothetical protein